MSPHDGHIAHPAPRSYHIWTIGCQMNQADSRHLTERLDALGMQHTPCADQADVIVLNTCVVRQQAEDKALGRLCSVGGIKKKRPHLFVALMGCLVGPEPSRPLQQRYPFVDAFIPPSGVDELVARLRAHDWTPGAPASPPGEVLPPPPGIAALVPVILGCSHGCAYCVIPTRRGPEQSRPPDVILDEVAALVASGTREVTLLGQIVDRYGLDLPGRRPRLPELLRRVAAIEGLLRLRFLTSHPNWITDELLETVAATPTLCPHLEIAVQSGNDDVLARMKRGYTREQYGRLIDRIRRILPDAALHTDLIVGFPGETEPAFLDSARLLEEIAFDKVHIAKYSVRPGTPAAALPDDVPPAEKERRRAHLEELQEGIQARANKALEGRVVETLVEGTNKGRLQGRTPQNKIVFFEGPRSLIGHLAEVRIDWAGPYSLVGSSQAQC